MAIIDLWHLPPSGFWPAGLWISGGKKTTFCSNGKFSLMKLLYALAGLCKETPLWPLWLDFFGLDIPPIPAHNAYFYFFVGMTTRGKVQYPSASSASQSYHLCNIAPPPPPTNYLLPRSDPCYAVPFHVAACHWRKAYLALRKIFSSCTHLVILLLLLQPGWVISPFDAAIHPIEDLYTPETTSHIWALLVLHYPRNMVICHYPPIGVIFMLILHVFIIKNCPNLFSNYYPKYTIWVIYPFL